MMKRKRGSRAKKPPLVSAPKGLLKTGIGCSNANETGFDNIENADSSDMNNGGLEGGLEKLINRIAADNVNSLRKAFSEMISSKKNTSMDFPSSSRRINTTSTGNVATTVQEVERTRQKEQRLPHQDRQYKEQELNDSLMVIKKIMKMDVAAPFNIPVNPIALGIPDYYDIIDTPMDFGTICNNLEKGIKYKNSEDVFKDVEYIWENCLKYNKRGDYILELMKQVKANFIKHWAAAGLHITEQQHTTHGYSHAPRAPLSESAVRHAKRMERGLVGSTSENPSRRHHHHHHRPLEQISDDQQPSEEEDADAFVGTTAEIGSSSVKKRRGRGPTRHTSWNTVGRIHIVTNEIGQPIGDDAPKLSNFLGTMARDGLLAPLTYSDWRAMPDSYKEKMWHQVQLKFDIDPKSKGWVLESLANKWRHWKCMLKTAHYNTHTTDEERLADRDERVLPDQWEYLISFWNSEEGEKRSAINKGICARRKFNHATGRKSFARIREEEKEKRPDGKEPTWAELFILTRTRKDGNPVNEASSTLISKLQECGRKQQEKLENGMTTQDEILLKVTGNGRSDRLLTYGIDVAGGGASSSVLGGRKPTRVEAIRKVTEANAEVHHIKERMDAMEQTCAHMSEQMAKMMSMMSSFMHSTVPTNNNSPNLDSDTSPLHQVRTPISERVNMQSRETRSTKRSKHTASTSVMNSKTK